MMERASSVSDSRDVTTVIVSTCLTYRVQAAAAASGIMLQRQTRGRQRYDLIASEMTSRKSNLFIVNPLALMGCSNYTPSIGESAIALCTCRWPSFKPCTPSVCHRAVKRSTHGVADLVNGIWAPTHISNNSRRQQQHPMMRIKLWSVADGNQEPICGWAGGTCHTGQCWMYKWFERFTPTRALGTPSYLSNDATVVGQTAARCSSNSLWWLNP